MGTTKKHPARSVDDVVALLHSDQESDRAEGILDPAAPPVEVLALATSLTNGYRVRAALVLSGVVPAERRRQLLRQEIRNVTRTEPGVFFPTVAANIDELTSRGELDEGTRAAIAAARTILARWESRTGERIVFAKSRRVRGLVFLVVAIAMLLLTVRTIAQGPFGPTTSWLFFVVSVQALIVLFLAGLAWVDLRGRRRRERNR